MRRADRQREAVGEEVEHAVGAGNREVDVVARSLEAGLGERCLGPVAHDVERGLTVDDLLRRVGPVEAITVGVGEAHERLEVLEGVGHIGPGPVGVPRPQPFVPLRAEVGQQHRLEQVHLRPRGGDRQGCLARLLDRLQRLDPFIDVGVLGLGVEARFLQNARVRPHHVGAVDVGGDRVDRAVDREPIDEVLGERLGQPELLIQIGDVFDLGGVDVVLQLGARVRLEGVGRVAGLQARLQQILRGGSRAARHRAVDELDVGVLFVEDLDECVQPRFLRSRGPPGEHLDFAAGSPVGTAIGRSAIGPAGAAG